MGDRGPDPAAVFSLEDLRTHIDRLRSRAAAGLEVRTYSLDRLAKSTSIPRSTLHTYLAGKSLPPADVLDRIVIALGATPAEQTQWGEAWERVSDLWRSTRTRTALSPAAQLASWNAQVNAALTRPTDRFADQLEPVVLSERITIGPHRDIAAQDVQATVRATADGPDRYFVKMGPRRGIHLDGLRVSNLVNCEEGEHRTLAEPQVRILEVVFDRPLVAGETNLFSFRVDYESARDPALAATPGTWVTECARGFTKLGPTYTLEVCFGGEICRTTCTRSTCPTRPPTRNGSPTCG